jgi:ribonuclease PH
MTDEIRPITIRRGYTCYAEGSVLIACGKTQVICTAMAQDTVPRHCLEAGRGWVTAEYCMLPSANAERRSLQGQPAGRSLEIQRLIGRALRASVDLYRLPGVTIWIDCDVIQADGGTRTTAITGGFVALVDALWALREKGRLEQPPLLHGLAAVSVGMVEGRPMVDLCAEEDRAASVDMNVVMTHDGRLIEIQGTAERQPFSQAEHDSMLALAAGAIQKIMRAQSDSLGERLELPSCSTSRTKAQDDAT